MTAPASPGESALDLCLNIASNADFPGVSEDIKAGRAELAALRAELAGLRSENAQLRDLVEEAYREGYGDGHDGIHALGGCMKHWEDSHVRTALAATQKEKEI